VKGARPASRVTDTGAKVGGAKAGAGDTFLPGGVRVVKSDPRIAALGDVDELNCVLGLLRLALSGAAQRLIGSIQSDLFDLGADLSRASTPWRMEHGRAARLEREALVFGKGLKPLRGFVVPGGTPAAAWCHLARAVCRRAERSAVMASMASIAGKAGAAGPARLGNPEAVRYLNRLSGLLFVLARRLAGARAVAWSPAGEV